LEPLKGESSARKTKGTGKKESDITIRDSRESFPMSPGEGRPMTELREGKLNEKSQKERNPLKKKKKGKRRKERV